MQGNDSRPMVLVAIHESLHRRLVSLSLTTDGFDVMVAATGDEAAEVFRRENPDAVVLDVELRRVDGLEVLRQIGLTSAVPVVILSGSPDSEKRLEALRLGATAFMAKPFEPDNLTARLRSALVASDEHSVGT